MNIRIGRRTAAVLGGLAVVASLLAAPPANADGSQVANSDPTSTGTMGPVMGGLVARSQILARAAVWTTENTVYTQDNSWVDTKTGGPYRLDCSGFVSMAWGLSKAYNTGELDSWSGKTYLGGADNASYELLQPGDALMTMHYADGETYSDAHIELFAGWATADHSKLNVYEEAHSPLIAEYTQETRSTLTSRGFRPLRYDNALGASGATYESVRTPAGQWGTNSQIGTNTAVSDVADAAMAGGPMHTLTLVPGSGVYDKTFTPDTGAWSSTTQISSTGSISAIAAAVLPNDTLHVETLVPGSGVYDKALSPSGTWTTSQISTTGSISAIAAAAMGDGTLHVETLVPGSGVYDKALSPSGTWTTTQISFNGDVTAIAAAYSNSELHVFTLVPGSGVWDLSRTTTGSWGAASQISQNGGIAAIAAAGPLSGYQIDLLTFVPGSGIYDRPLNTITDTWAASAADVDADGSVVRMAAASLNDGTMHLTTLN